jgi:hypothetical protein
MLYENEHLSKKNRWRAIKIVGTREKGVGACEKADGTRENAVGASEKCRILCKNLQKLSKNEKFHKILRMFFVGLRAGRDPAPQTPPAPFFKKNPRPAIPHVHF